MIKFDLRKEVVGDTLFPKQYINYLNNDIEFIYSRAGEEHYKLLATITNSLSNAKILDLGTYIGHNAVALAGNLSNTVFSFDIADSVYSKCRKKPNVRYYVYDLLNEDNRKHNKDLILQSDIILVDVSPHDGIVEKDFYEWLRVNNYNGLIIWDDIYLNDNMTTFWKSIPEENKIDLTGVGHITGSGITFFNLRKYKFIL
jgi:predicted O-methyltransferase YrrM